MNQHASQPVNQNVKTLFENDADVDQGTLPFAVSNCRLSLSFQELGRESLGILTPDYLMKDSLSFLNHSLSDCFFRDSLNCNVQFDNFGRESIEGGRESLGILQIQKLDLKFGDENPCIPELVLPTIDENSTDVGGYSLNAAFLFSNSRQIISSGDSSAIPSFNVTSLDGPSKIYELSKSDSPNNTKPALSFLNDARLLDSELGVSRQRFLSLPDNIGDGMNVPKITLSFQDQLFENNIEDKFYDSVFIEGGHIANKIADGSILNKSFEGTDVLDSTPQPIWPTEFDESKEAEIPVVETKTVFKEVDRLVPANVRIISNLPLHQEDTVKTPSPQTVEKASKSETSDCHLRDPRLMLQNLSEILNNTKHSNSQKSEGQNLISSLAEILFEKSSASSKKNIALDDSGHSSISEQSDSSDKIIPHECKALDLSKKSVDDPRSSSSNQALDLSLKTRIGQVDVNNCLSQSFGARNPTMTITDPIKKNPSLNSLDCLASKNIVKNLTNQGGEVGVSNFKTKLRSVPATTNKKGPLKATIPVKEIKSKASATPEKMDKQVKSIRTRTSTPIRETSIKPMAASTPKILKDSDSSPKLKPRLQSSPKSSTHLSVPRGRVSSAKGENLSEVPQIRKLSTVTTLLPQKGSISTYTQKSTTDKINRIPSIPSTSRPKSMQSPSLLPKMDTKPYRRNSVSEDKRISASEGNASGLSTLRRRNSIEKESGIVDIQNRLKQASESKLNIGSKVILSENNNNIGLNFKIESSKHYIPIVNKKTKGKENAVV